MTRKTGLPATIRNAAIATLLACGALAANAGSALAIDPFFPGFGNNGIDVLHYNLELDVNPVSGRLDGKGAWRDNVFVERLGRTVKYEEVYLKAYASVSEARASLGRYFTFYNTRRPHQALDGRPPDRAYFTPQQLPAAA
jgi:putative transposase